jgi:hypothetical protein
VLLGCAHKERLRGPASYGVSGFVVATVDAVSAFASVVTGSKSFMLSTSHGIALLFRVRVSPLLAGVAREIAPSRGSSSTRQGISLEAVTNRPFGTVDGPVISAGLPASPQGPDHLFISRAAEMAGVWSLRIPLARFPAGFPAWPLSCHPPTELSPSRYATSTDRMRPGFPANSQLHSPTSPLGGAAPLACQGASCNLRTVIVRYRLPHIAMRPGPYLHPSASKGSSAYGL